MEDFGEHYEYPFLNTQSNKTKKQLVVVELILKGSAKVKTIIFLLLLLFLLDRPQSSPGHQLQQQIPWWISHHITLAAVCCCWHSLGISISSHGHFQKQKNPGRASYFYVTQGTLLSKKDQFPKINVKTDTHIHNVTKKRDSNRISPDLTHCTFSSASLLIIMNPNWMYSVLYLVTACFWDFTGPQLSPASFLFHLRNETFYVSAQETQQCHLGDV